MQLHWRVISQELAKLEMHKYFDQASPRPGIYFKEFLHNW